MKIVAESYRRFGKAALRSAIENSQVARHGLAKIGVPCHLSATGSRSFFSRQSVRQLGTLEGTSSGIYDDREEDETTDLYVTSDWQHVDRAVEVPDEYELLMNPMKAALDVFHHQTSISMASSLEEPVGLRDDGQFSSFTDPLAVDISHYRGESGDEYSPGVCGE